MPETPTPALRLYRFLDERLGRDAFVQALGRESMLGIGHQLAISGTLEEEAAAELDDLLIEVVEAVTEELRAKYVR